jgi:hypothetical protein
MAELAEIRAVVLRDEEPDLVGVGVEPAFGPSPRTHPHVLHAAEVDEGVGLAQPVTQHGEQGQVTAHWSAYADVVRRRDYRGR